MGRINFGTDGWRAVIAEDFTFANVRAICQAIADYINTSDDPGTGVVIGYDQRFLSEEFAQAASEVMAANGVKVYLVASPTPTPVTAYAVKHWNCKGAVMFTASHNPAIYHGIKFIPYFAGPALPETTSQIEMLLNDIELGKKQVKRIPFDKVDNENIAVIKPANSYLDHLKDIVDLSVIKRRSPKVVVDPMHGAGIGYLEEFLQESGCQVISIRSFRDPFFGGEMPEPKEEYLDKLKEKVLEENADIGMALDGDGDRFGVIDKNGEYFSPNQILVLILDHLVTIRGWSGPVARTVATTHMIDRICTGIGEKSYETPVGFKYIGQELRGSGCILGGEESGGISVGNHIPEKDGILACLLILEMISASGVTVSKKYDQIQDRYGRCFSKRVDLKVLPEEKEKFLNRVQEYYPEEIGGKAVVERNTSDGVKLILEDGSWLLIRSSGTEPVFRIYTEAFTEEEIESLQQYIQKEIFQKTE